MPPAGLARTYLFLSIERFPLEVASLRERHEDIPLLAKHFVDLVVKETESPTTMARRAFPRFQTFRLAGKSPAKLRNVMSLLSF